MLFGTDLDPVVLGMGHLGLGRTIIGPPPVSVEAPLHRDPSTPAPDEGCGCGDGEQGLGHGRELFVVAHQAPVLHAPGKGPLHMR